MRGTSELTFVPDGVLKDVARRGLSYLDMRRRIEARWAEENLEEFSRIGNDLKVRLRDGTTFFSGMEEIEERPNWRFYLPCRLNRWRLFEELLDIHFRREYEQYHAPKIGQVCADVGAHIGLFTVRAARMVGQQGKVIAIEPVAENVRYLRKNVAANGLKNVIIVEKGAWSSTDSLELHGGEYSVSWSFKIPQRKRLLVRVAPLDEVFEQHGLTEIGYMKLDIEGAELEALHGAERTLVRDDVKLAIAGYHILENGKGNRESITRYLRNLGFHVREKWRKRRIIYAAKS